MASIRRAGGGIFVGRLTAPLTARWLRFEEWQSWVGVQSLSEY